MTWASVRAQLVTIVEGTTVPAKTRGKSPAFKYAPDANDVALPFTRGFWVSLSSMSVRGPTPIGFAYRQRDMVELSVVYHRDFSPRDLDDCIAADYREITKRLANPSTWGRPTSTIIALSESASDDQFVSSIDDVDGARILRVSFPVLHEVT